MIVRSSGISLAYLGPLQASPQPPEGPRQFEFHFPLNPRPAQGPHPHVPPAVAGVFVNGMPIYNQLEALSYQGQNIWHFDPIQMGRQGESPPGLIESLIPDSGRHSPIIGYAFDGYPVYGPWGFVGSGQSLDPDQKLLRMRSSYRLRNINERISWPDGVKLTPGQYGPLVSPEVPVGTFVEDYEYVPGSGDLDRYNGRFSRTPEYPAGTYAYFLATDDAGRTAFPYLLASEFYGDSGARRGVDLPLVGSHNGVVLRAAKLVAGGKTVLRLDMPARFLEYVHEKPIHMMIVSEDLADFAHIHPELTAEGDWEVSYTFPRSGRYRVYLEFTPPGQGQRLEFFDLTVPGPSTKQPIGELNHTQRSGSLQVAFSSAHLSASQDIELRFAISNPELLQPYLGAWAHFTLVDEGLSAFIHAHPMGDAPEAVVHTHGVSSAPAGFAPSELRTVVSFPHAGLYKLWAQFQVAGRVEVLPFVLRVDAAPARAKPPLAEAPPPGAIHISVTAAGYAPARVDVPKDAPVKLWFTRTGQPNCGSQVVFPSLNLKRDLPLGGSVLVELPAQPSGELRFTCGMKMFHGMIVVR
jgi:hypothetical protein